LIVPADRNEEEETIHILEAMDPLFPFRSLTANIKHPVRERPQIKYRFRDTRRP
jgi:hypothetical protein